MVKNSLSDNTSSLSKNKTKKIQKTTFIYIELWGITNRIHPLILINKDLHVWRWYTPVIYLGSRKVRGPGVQGLPQLHSGLRVA